MKNIIYLFLVAVFCISIQSCADKVDEAVYHYTQEEYELLSQKLDLPEKTYDYTQVTNRPIPGFNPDLPFHKSTLGRVLFYDKMLSIDGSTSCASCHQQSAAFADTEKFSEGLESQIGKRNSLPLGNTIGFVKYYGTDLSVQTGFFSWDESFMTIDEQSTAAITSPVEMGHNMWDLTQMLREREEYQILFEKAYGPNQITEANLTDAITSFVNSMSSRESKFDQSLAANPNAFDVFTDFSLFSDSENRGKELFNNNCSTCHGSSHNSIVLSSANNGLDMNYEDKGVGAKQNASHLNGVFKVPSLRNIELTGPYMHDGRFASLEEVIEHYSTGVKNHENLSQFLKTGNQAKKFDFSSTDKQDLINYLQTLTDDVFVAEVKYTDPFK